MFFLPPTSSEQINIPVALQLPGAWMKIVYRIFRLEIAGVRLNLRPFFQLFFLNIPHDGTCPRHFSTSRATACDIIYYSIVQLTYILDSSTLNQFDN